MQKTMPGVHKRLDHHYARLANSKEVLTKHLSFMQGQPRSRKQYQAQFSEQNSQLSRSLGRANAAQDSVRQVFKQTDTDITLESKSPTGGG